MWACGGGLGSTRQAGFVSAITTSCLAGQSARAYAPGGGVPAAAVGAAWSAAGCGGLTPGASDKRAAFETADSPSGESGVLEGCGGGSCVPASWASIGGGGVVSGGTEAGPCADGGGGLAAADCVAADCDAGEVAPT